MRDFNDRTVGRRRLVLLIALFLLLSSCGYPTMNRATSPGLYECTNPHGGPTYLLHTEDPETLYYRGGGIALKFRDRNTGDLVELGRNSGYRCEKVEVGP